MSYLSEYKRKFNDLRTALDVQNRSQLRARANGGNTVLFAYQPSEESLYLAQVKKQFPTGEFIDLSKLLVDYVDESGWEDFKQFYKDYEMSSDQVFKSEDGEDIDFFDSIMNAIQKAFDAGKTPFLIRTGILHGTGIENVNIMEHKVVMNCTQLLVIFYPARIETDNIFFLNFKPANQYRCTIID